MFAYLKGRVSHIEVDRVTLDVGGVGYELFASGKTLGALNAGDDTRLFVHMHMTQDLLALYGFLSSEEKQLFRRMIGVSRVGPKVALAALTALSAQELAIAIAVGDEHTLSRVPGLGKKTAQRMILELKEKIAIEEAVNFTEHPPGGRMSGNAMQQEAITALIALGYDAATAARAVNSVTQPCERVEELITTSLKSLG